MRFGKKQYITNNGEVVQTPRWRRDNGTARDQSLPKTLRREYEQRAAVAALSQRAAKRTESLYDLKTRGDNGQYRVFHSLNEEWLEHVETTVQGSFDEANLETLIAPLTKSQQEVARLIARRHTNKEMAAFLGVTERAIEYRRQGIRKRLGNGGGHVVSDN